LNVKGYYSYLASVERFNMQRGLRSTTGWSISPSVITRRISPASLAYFHLQVKNAWWRVPIAFQAAGICHVWWYD
jgi:hypothetical protein